MAFTNSHVFSSFLADVMASTNAWNLAGDTFYMTLFTNTTDDATFKFDTLTKNSYNGTSGQFVVANEIPTAGTYTRGTGYNFAGPSLTFASSGAADSRWSLTNFSAAAQTLSTGFFGCLIADSTLTVATFHPGVCAVAFGGSYTVGGGTFAINWGTDPTNGVACVFYITV